MQCHGGYRYGHGMTAPSAFPTRAPVPNRPCAGPRPAGGPPRHNRPAGLYPDMTGMYAVDYGDRGKAWEGWQRPEASARRLLVDGPCEDDFGPGCSEVVCATCRLTHARVHRAQGAEGRRPGFMEWVSWR